MLLSITMVYSHTCGTHYFSKHIQQVNDYVKLHTYLIKTHDSESRGQEEAQQHNH